MTFQTITRAVITGAAVVGLTVATAACNRTEPAKDTGTPAATPDAPGAGPTAPDTYGVSSDARISTAVQAKYYGDDRIRGRNIDVDAENGVVTLRGTVPDDAAKQHAVTLARSVEGVTNVNDQLEVRAETADARTRDRDAGAATGTTGRDDDQRSPGWITTKIQAQYFANPEIKPWNIDVTTGSGGVVTLEGKVDSENDKNEAVRIARGTEGVTRVDDRLKVDPNARKDEEKKDTERDTKVTGDIERPDVWLTAKVQSKYFVDDEVKGRRIDVDTNNGVVTLKGTVGSEGERRQAVSLAQNTEGVRDVKDELRVDASLRTRKGDTDVTDRTKRTVETVERPDAWITMKVQAKYFLDADVKGHEINVDTKNGVVTLKGTVENAQQKQEAEQIAKQTEGVKRVVNQLTVGTTQGG